MTRHWPNGGGVLPGEPIDVDARRNGMRSPALVLTTITVSLGLLTGCSASDPGSPAAPPATTTATAATPATTATPTAAAGDGTPGGTADAGTTRGPGVTESAATVDRVTLTRSGGFAGNRDTVTVEPDGRWTTTDRAGTTRTGRLTPAQLDQLRTLTGPATRSRGGPPDGRCADTYAYQLTVGTRSVEWSDCPSGPQPPAAAPQLAALLLKTTTTG
ncbi:hypothetical protein GA0070216_10960 [Micromonospora matsumotoense]|uniref:Uncharacterized protein n=2 Tax=Micromonospora matsumotoense TaxID=121616 RepID=A0A1C4ZBZ8_9ACTN|nr:hypothetical protein GA0070216_10960 [Micromonospora matsumotoense]